ncbi:hypothetical protein CBS147324_8289 [Aspergillus niger]|nr:hypothetical protein CBS147324_8289 [Aspergillus niger]
MSLEEATVLLPGWRSASLRSLRGGSFLSGSGGRKVFLLALGVLVFILQDILFVVIVDDFRLFVTAHQETIVFVVFVLASASATVVFFFVVGVDLD